MKMSRLFVLAALLMFPAVQAQTDERRTVETFFEAFHARDTTALSRMFEPSASLHTVVVRPTGNSVKAESIADFLKGMASIPAGMRFEEKLTSWSVDTSGELASVWTDYEFYVDGKLSHRGVNCFVLYKSADGWKILSLQDTRKR